ncbi:hypothetical protein Q2T46_11720 [Thermoanaerobacterium sp. CMT5567-10]|uniref:hypothetical protein n=1 Tax=Thermoanaerobacterium sp. CMT5567-10 TaxID=3061989 RepID=UPI0026DFDC1D|nr:hypothetical protein [Thermoanaerobacterium sp. CMT5567-10]WKV08195.1 hypothetical protein Q2T46_11720 [Thermoanaerobacterium sp. CMT5567-10]
MTNYELRIKKAIEQNPIMIVINRTEKKDMGGYFDEIKSQHGPYVACIYQQSTRISKDVATLAGTKQVDKTFILIADKYTDIRSGPNVKDEFDVDFGHFMITAVYPIMIKDQLIGYQADLEKVS